MESRAFVAYVIGANGGNSWKRMSYAAWAGPLPLVGNEQRVCQEFEISPIHVR